MSDEVAYSDAEHGAAPDTTDPSWSERGYVIDGSPAATMKRSGRGKAEDLERLRNAAKANAHAVHEAYRNEPKGLAAMPLIKVFAIGVAGGAALVILLGLGALLFG